MSEIIRLTTPLTDKVIEKLKIGVQVLITGTLYTARDAAHKRLVDLLNNGKELPFDIRGQIIYYVGPAPAKPGYVTGPAGPTTSGRMDPYAPRLMEAGMKGKIGNLIFSIYNFYPSPTPMFIGAGVDSYDNSRCNHSRCWIGRYEGSP